MAVKLNPNKIAANSNPNKILANFNPNKMAPNKMAVKLNPNNMAMYDGGDSPGGTRIVWWCVKAAGVATSVCARSGSAPPYHTSHPSSPSSVEKNQGNV